MLMVEDDKMCCCKVKDCLGEFVVVSVALLIIEWMLCLLMIGELVVSQLTPQMWISLAEMGVG